MDDRVSIGDLVETLGRIQVQPGSPADHVDRVLRPAGLSLSGTVVELVRSALDHLDLASRDGDPHEFAHPTLLRSAITTASTALWMMAGTTDEQCYRALQFGFRDQVFRHQYLETARADPTERAAVDARCDELAAAARALRPGTSARRFHTIDSDSYIVAQAGLLMAPDALGGRDPAVEVLTQWNLLSAYAHGRSWAAGVPEGERLDSDRVALAVVAAAVARLARLADVSGGG